MLIKIRREEFKYYIGLDQIDRAKTILSSLMHLDKACENHNQSYLVKSLYFDTPDSKDLNEKLDGIIDREKFRIRTYPKSTLQEAYKLERKAKIDNVIEKTSLELSPETIINFQEGVYDEMLNLDNQFALNCYHTLHSKGYRPKIIVEYDRMAFTLPFCNIRVTIDMNLSTYNGGLDLQNEHLSKTPIYLDGMAILEIKFEKYFPSHIHDALAKLSLKRCAISKFVLSRVNIASDSWSDHLIRPF